MRLIQAARGPDILSGVYLLAPRVASILHLGTSLSPRLEGRRATTAPECSVPFRPGAFTLPPGRHARATAQPAHTAVPDGSVSEDRLVAGR